MSLHDELREAVQASMRTTTPTLAQVARVQWALDAVARQYIANSMRRIQRAKSATNP